MWVLWGDYVIKCSLTNMDANIRWLAKKINEEIGRLLWILWGKNNVECTMKYSYVCTIACPNQYYVYS